MSADIPEKDIFHVIKLTDADTEPKLTTDSADLDDLLPAPVTFVFKLTFVNNTFDDLVDEATDLAD